MILPLPNFGEGCRRYFFLCRTLANAAEDDFTITELWRKLPKMILPLLNFGEGCRRDFCSCRAIRQLPIARYLSTALQMPPNAGFF
jgi:hypothetical protein